MLTKLVNIGITSALEEKCKPYDKGIYCIHILSHCCSILENFIGFLANYLEFQVSFRIINFLKIQYILKYLTARIF